MTQPDLRNRARGVWLVKFDFLYRNPKEKPEVMFHLSGEPDPMETEEVPKEHKFVVGSLNSQSLAVLSEETIGKDDILDEEPRKLLIFEGRVVQRAECRPPQSINYMEMKKQHIEAVSKPTVQIKTIEKAEVKFKPIARHAEQAVVEKAKKEGKNVRLDKEAVLNLLFQAFEKHQYYKLVDLARVTAQPPNYVKEILQEIAVYNTMPPHKYTWELKPEYGHYKNEEMATS